MKNPSIVWLKKPVRAHCRSQSPVLISASSLSLGISSCPGVEVDFSSQDAVSVQNGGEFLTSGGLTQRQQHFTFLRDVEGQSSTYYHDPQDVLHSISIFFPLFFFFFAASFQARPEYTWLYGGGEKCWSHQWEQAGPLKWAHPASKCSAACVFSLQRKLHPRLLTLPPTAPIAGSAHPRQTRC